MSKEYNKKETHQTCKECDFQKLKQLDNNPEVRKLSDKIEQLNFKLTECSNDNQMLKRNLQLAKKMVCQEVGGEGIDFPTLMKHGTESGCKGRQEDIFVLKTKVQELKGYLKELEGDLPTPQGTPSEEYLNHQRPNGSKKLWRMELERRLAREDAEKDINPLVQECDELRKNLDAEKNRFRQLTQEVKLLRTELQSQIEKNEEDFGIVKSFKTLEKQLEDTLKERTDIRQNLSASRAQNERLEDELKSLEEELQVIQKKTNDNKAFIDSLTSSHKCIQEAIEAEKMIVQQNVEGFKDELKLLQENHVTDCDILDHLQCIICDRNSLIDALDKDVDSSWMKEFDHEEDASNNLKKPPSESSTKLQLSATSNNPKKLPSKSSTKLQPSSTSSNTKRQLRSKSSTKLQESASKNNTNKDTVSSASDSQLKIYKLRLDCAKYKALCEASQMESDRLSDLIESQGKKMNEVAVQGIETGNLIMQKNAEKKELVAQINKIQRCLSAKHKKCKRGQPKIGLDEIKIKIDAQKIENEYLRNFLRSAVCDKDKDLQEIKGFITDSEHFFKVCLKEMKELLESEKPAGIALESMNELNN